MDKSKKTTALYSDKEKTTKRKKPDEEDVFCYDIEIRSSSISIVYVGN